MIYVSMIEIFFKAQEALVAQMGHRIGSWITVAAFFGGMLVIAIIDKLIPPGENPHEIRKIEDVQTKDPQPKRLMRMGIFTVLAIAIHNSPEGLAAFVSALQEPSIAIPIVAAIAIHNIPVRHAYTPFSSAAYIRCTGRLPFFASGSLRGACPQHNRRTRCWF